MRVSAGDMTMSAIERADVVTVQRGQGGFSLIELMIAMLIGLILIAGTFTIFISNSESFRLQRALSDSQESGRFALDFIARDVRRAGIGCAVPDDGLECNAVVTAQQAIRPVLANGENSILIASDAITVRYLAQPGMTDCQGNVRALINNRYYVAVDADGSIALFCDGTGGNAGTALVQGVEGFQLQYGVAAPGTLANGLVSPSRYISNPVAGDRVATVRLALLVRSNEGVRGLPSVAQPFPMLNGNVAASAMNAVTINSQPVVHRLFVSTVALRNLGS